MKKTFIKSHKLQSEFFRISNYLIDDSISIIKEKTHEQDEIVHTLRKRVKNLRTILKLLRKEVGEDFYKKNNFLLRDLNRRSASIRNYFALFALVESNIEQNNDQQISEALTLLLHRLKSDFENIKSQTDYSTIFNSYEAQLEKYHSHLKKLKESANRFSIFRSGFVKIYTEGKELLKICMVNPSDENLHEWRKCTKDYYYVTSSLSPIWPTIYETLAKEIKILSDMLGQVNDYSELNHYMQTLIDNPFDFTLLFDFVETNKQKLIDESYKLGKRVFAISSDTFSENFKAYYLAYKKE